MIFERFFCECALPRGPAFASRMKVRFRETDAIFKTLLDSTHDAIVVVNATGKIELVNRPAEHWFGYEERELIGQPIEILVPERYREAHVGHVARYFVHPETRPMDHGGRALVARRKDGSEFPVDISLGPARTDRGLLVTAVVRDITERRRVDQRLRFIADSSRILNEVLGYDERLQRMANLIVPDLADCCVVSAWEEEELRYVAFAHRDPSKTALLRDTLRGLSIRMDCRWASPAVIRSGNSQYIESMSPEVLREVVPDPKDAARLSKLGLSSWVSVPLLARGRTTGTLLLFMADSGRRFSRDDLEFAELVATRSAMVLENARLYSEARRAIRAREEVLAIVSHELKNPLSVITTSSEMITLHLPECAKREELAKLTENITRSSRRMSRLIADLLDYSKIQAGTFHIEARKVEIRPFLEEQIGMLAPLADEKGIRLTVDLPGDLPALSCDPHRIAQVLSNLLGNAIKFTPPKGAIRVSARASEREISFSVGDTGPGIPKSQLPHVFDRYWQARETARMGTGLGLSIASGIVHSHRGRIWVESEEGKGSVFSFAIPK